MKIYKATCELFEIMETAEKIYKGGNTSKTTTRADANRASYGRKRKGGEDALPNKPETGCSGKREKKSVGHPSDRPTRGKICLLHGPVQSTEYCKVLKD